MAFIDIVTFVQQRYGVDEARARRIAEDVKHLTSGRIRIAERDALLAVLYAEGLSTGDVIMDPEEWCRHGGYGSEILAKRLPDDQFAGYVAWLEEICPPAAERVRAIRRAAGR